MALAAGTASLPFSPSSPSSPSPPSPSLSFRVSRTYSSMTPVSYRNRVRIRARLTRPRATLTVDSPASGAAGASGPGRVLLEVRDLKAVVKNTGTEILHGVNLTINEGEVLVGHPDYEVTGGIVLFKGENLMDKEPEERSLAGLFLSFQAPVEIPGVSNSDFLLMALNARREKHGLPAMNPLEFFHYVLPKVVALKMEPKFLDRNVNEGFSGGEKKRNEILQLAVLEADLAILDEIDSGLDVDALQEVANAVNGLLKPSNSVLMITHYRRLLDYIKPRYIHIMDDGKIIRTGDISLAKQLEEGGYQAISVV
ncbi:ABC transporter I family member 6, chloroplastic isoform X2 [Typha latifolia]|uniref:ABC transporter I family member 6, chloroplastic isoform X2 n=1 Tax=Typha latifolia TaxID=4733 RepID=UPI003C2DF1EE